MTAFKGEKKVVELVYDFAKHGGAVGAISLTDPTKVPGAAALPQGFVVEAVRWRVLAAPTSGGSATVSIGDVGDAARYKALTAYNNAAYALDAVQAAAIGAPALVSSANIANFGITVAVAALTAGKIVFWVEGYCHKASA